MINFNKLPEIKFPKGFLWGSSTAAQQIEGDNFNNDWYRAEQAGKFRDPCGKACNSYALYREDIALLKELGHQAYRFSVEWSRIEPRQGEFDAAATEHYVDQCRRLVEAGIQPWVTLHHFSNPLWFSDLGEWNKRENLTHFLRFAEFIVPKLAPFVAGWTPINEYNLHGGRPPQPEQHLKMANYKINLLFADAAVYDLIKHHSSAPVGSPLAYVPAEPVRAHDEFDRLMTGMVDWTNNGFYLHAMRTGELVFPFVDGGFYPELKGRCDFWAVNIYARHMVDSRKADAYGQRYLHAKEKMIGQDFWFDEISPDAVLDNLVRLQDKPVYITENGCCCDDDRYRIRYMATHYAAFRNAIDLGVDLRGLFHWSFLDNWEWGSYAPRLGLVDVDRTTFQRTPKPSAWFYKDIIAANGLSGDMVCKYLDQNSTP